MDLNGQTTDSPIMDHVLNVILPEDGILSLPISLEFTRFTLQTLFKIMTQRQNHDYGKLIKLKTD